MPRQNSPRFWRAGILPRCARTSLRSGPVAVMADRDRRSRRPPGRPRLDPEQRRSKSVTASLTPAEYQRVRAQAEARNVPLHEYLRARLLSQRLPVKPTIPEINQEALRELVRMGTNLNQVIRAVHTPAVLRAEAEGLRSALREFAKQITQLRDAQ